MANPFAELMRDYVAECLPMAEEVADGFVEVERRWADGRGGDDLFPALKQSLHTIKGNSGMMGLDSLQATAHAIEDLCAHLLARPARRGAGAAAILVEGGGLLVDTIRQAAESTPDDAVLGAYVARVRALIASPAGRESAAPAVPRPDATSAAAAPGAADDTVRVDFRRLDVMLEVLGEAVIAHSGLVDIGRRLRARLGRDPEVHQLEGAVEILGKIVKRMESALMETRLLPVSTVFARFTRRVRDLAHAQDKRARLVLDGGDLLLDKTILDRLGEPLLHMVRNSLAHGIESPAERQRAGKPPEGTIRLAAAALADRMLVTVSDDGRGLDRERILSRARELGLEPEGSGEAEIFGLIFLPGFSTAGEVSELAGRGVGLDVVAASLHAMGGAVEVASAPGAGTTFTLTLPLTLAVVRSLILEVDRERFAMPLTHVEETVRVGEQTVQAINRRGVTVWRDDLIHVADGGVLLGTRPVQAGPRHYCIVLAAGARRKGMLVDRLLGHQEVVVKGLDPALGRPKVVSGTTILGDGRVACILDAGHIVDVRTHAAEPAAPRA